MVMSQKIKPLINTVLNLLEQSYAFYFPDRTIWSNSTVMNQTFAVEYSVKLE